jgi:hypothetical protein
MGRGRNKWVWPRQGNARGRGLFVNFCLRVVHGYGRLRLCGAGVKVGNV